MMLMAWSARAKIGQRHIFCWIFEIHFWPNLIIESTQGWTRPKLNVDPTDSNCKFVVIIANFGSIYCWIIFSLATNLRFSHCLGSRSLSKVSVLDIFNQQIWWILIIIMLSKSNPSTRYPKWSRHDSNN